MGNNKIPFDGAFPSQMVSSKQKSSEEYGKLYASAILKEFKGDDNNWWKKRREKFELSRKYANGRQPVQKYLDLLDIEGDNSWTNINVDPLSIIPKFVDIIVGGETQRKYEPIATSVDPTAAYEKETARKKIIADMLTYNMEAKLAEKTGGEPPKRKFESLEEVELHLQLTFKLAVEIAAEMGIKFVFDNEDIDSIRTQIIYDLVTNDLACTRTYLDPNYGIRIKRVKPENAIYGFSDKMTMDDLTYAGEMFVSNISEIRRMFNVNEDKLKRIASTASKQNNPDVIRARGIGNSYNSYYDQPYDDTSITVMYFEFKTTEKIVYEKKENKYGGYSVHKRDDDYKIKKYSKLKRELLEKEVETIYCGYYAVEANEILKYGKQHNIERKKTKSGETDLTKASLSFNFYSTHINKGESKSLVERMIPYADEMQIASLKLQQLVAKSRPPGIAIDQSALTNIMLKKDEKAAAIDVIKFFNQTGNMVWSSEDLNGDNQRPPIEPLRNGIDVGQVQAIVSVFQQNLQMIRDVTGVNEARDASQPSTDTLVGVQQLALAASNNATRGITDGWTSVISRTASSVLEHLQAMASVPGEFEAYAKALGMMNSKTYKDIKDIPYRDIGISIEVEPNEYEKQVLEANIQASIAQGAIGVEDAIAVRRIWNTKLAEQLIILRKKKNEQRKMEMKNQEIQMQSQAKAQAAQAQAQAEMQKNQQKSKFDLMKINAEMEKEAYLIQLEKSLEQQIQQGKNIKDVQVANISSGAKYSLDKMKEDNKMDRQIKQAEMTSKIAEQKQNNLPAQEFEENTDIEQILTKARNDRQQ